MAQSNGKWEKSGDVTPLLEWQTCDNDAEWQGAQQATLTPPLLGSKAAQWPHWVVRHWRIGAALLMILAIIGGWMWSSAQRGVAQIETELHEQVELELWSVTTSDNGLRSASEQEIRKLSISAQDDKGRPLTSTVKLLDFPGETAIVQLVTQPGAGQPALRQTRFYRQTADGWQRTKPEAELWGAPRLLESSHFIFHFRQNDAQVVKLVASQMDGVYAELQRNFDLSPNAEKMVIEVTVEQVTGALFIHRSAGEPLVVPSPAVYLAPVDLSDKAILAQSIGLPFIEYMGQRAIEEHAIPSRWQPILPGIQLWQLWNLDLPLAQWQPELVKWIYVDAPLALAQHQPMLPARYQEICAMHRLWMLAPVGIEVPLSCTSWDRWIWSWSRWVTYVPRTRLDQLNVPQVDLEIPHDVQSNDSYRTIEAVTVATLAAYVVAVYGDEKLQALLAGLAHYDSWETLVPAIFGVTAADFEAGWRSYLSQQYGVSLSD